MGRARAAEPGASDRAGRTTAPVAPSSGRSCAVALAVAASPLSPIGAARTFEPNPGLELNVALLALGGAAWLGLCTLLLRSWPGAAHG